jgi:hypothetical protein
VLGDAVEDDGVLTDLELHAVLTAPEDACGGIELVSGSTRASHEPTVATTIPSSVLSTGLFF